MQGTVTRRLAAVGVAVLASLAVAAPALAASGHVSSPSTGTVISEAVVLVIDADASSSTNPFATVDSVTVRLSSDGSSTAPGTSARSAECVSGCGSDSSTWQLNFDPVTFAPFGEPDAGTCNGGWYLQPDVNGDGYSTGVRLVVAVPPTAPTDVVVAPGVETASVSWTGAPEPDITGYRLQRRPTGGSWATVATVASDVSTYREDLDAGSYDYRVVSLRGDGKTADGQPTQPCADTGGDLEAASQATSATVRAPATRPSPSPTPTATETETGGGGTTTGGTTGGSTGGSTTGSTSGSTSGSTTGSSTTGTPSEEPSPSESPTRRTVVVPRQAPPPNVGNDSASGRLGLQLPSEPEVADDRYYGDDQEFSDTLDFGDIDPVTGERVSQETRVVAVPGVLQTVFGEEIALSKLLGSITGGMIVITLALHLRRWMHEGHTL